MQQQKSATHKALPYLIGIAGLILTLGVILPTLKNLPSPAKSENQLAANLKPILKNGRPDSAIARATWFQDIAPQPLVADARQRVLIALPSASGVSYRHATITTVEAGRATAALDPDPIAEASAYRTQYSDLPGELVFPRPEAAENALGDWAIGVSYEGTPFLGRITANINGHRELLYYDRGIAKTEGEFIFPLTDTVAPLQAVIFSEPRMKETAYHLGFAAFLTSDGAYVRRYGSTAKPELIPNERLTPLRLHPSPFEVGDTVWANTFSSGYKQATVTKVLEAGLLYDVNIGNQPKTSRFSRTVASHVELLKNLPTE